MADDTQQAQSPKLDPGFDYAKLPDGSYAKFKKGTPEAEMRGRLIAAGKLPATPVTPQQVKSAAPATKTPQPGFWKRYGQTMMLPTSKPELKSALEGASGAGFAYQTGKGIYEGAKSAVGDVKQGKYLEAAHDVSGALMPFATMLGTNVGSDVRNKNIRGLGGTGAGIITQALIMRGGHSFTDPEALRTRAKLLDNKVIKAAANEKGYNLSPALQVAKEGIIGTLKSLPDKIEAKRVAKNTQVQSIARQLDAQGVTIDVENEIDPIVQDVKFNANQRGTWTPQLKNQITSLTNRITTELDMQTGATRPRNLKTLKISDAFQLQKGLDDLSAFGSQTPDAISNLARRVRGVIGEKLAKASPEMQRLRAEESELIEARQSARDNYVKVLNDGRAGAKGFIYSNYPTAGVYLGLKALGLPFAGAIATALTLRTLGESAPSRTFRAAMYAKAADLLDGTLLRNSGPQGPSAPGTAIQPQQGGIQPTGPQGAPNARLTGGPAAQGGGAGMGYGRPQAPPTAPASVVSTNPPTGVDVVPTERPLTRGTMLPERATRARAGSGDYVKGETSNPGTIKDKYSDAWMLREKLLDRLSVAREQSKLEDLNQKADDQTITLKDLGGSLLERKADIKKALDAYAEGKADFKQIQLLKKLGAETAELNHLEELHSKGRNVAESNTKTKAMMDRLDTLYERMDHPKSGADRSAIFREIAEIKRVLSGEAKANPETITTGNKRPRTFTEEQHIERKAAKRDYMAAQRAEAKASTPGTSTTSQVGTTTEPAARADASPENRAMLLDMGYKKLATYEGGPEFVKALKEQAKTLQKVDPSFDEVTALAEALKALKEVTGN